MEIKCALRLKDADIIDIIKDTLPYIQDTTIVKLFTLICAVNYNELPTNILNGYSFTTNNGTKIDVYFMKYIICEDIDHVMHIKYSVNNIELRIIEVVTDNYVLKFIVKNDHVIISCEYDC